MAQLAQLNIARRMYAQDGAEMRDFVEALDPVNALADRSPGFKWRLQDGDDDSALLAQYEQDGWLVNLSVWADLASLKQFVMQPLHLSIMRRRAEWFKKQTQATMVLWWIDDDHIPGFPEALNRLESLRKQGPNPEAFSFSQPFPAPTEVRSGHGG